MTTTETEMKLKGLTPQFHSDAVELETHANWRAGDIGDTDHWTLRLTAAHHAELDAALEHARSVADDVLDVTADHFPLPTLAPRLAEMAEELVNGRGFARIAALDVEQREVGGVVGHEAHARLGAIGDAGDGVGRLIHPGALGAAKTKSHRSYQFGEQGALGREVPVEEALGDAGRLTDVGDAGGRVAAVGEQLACGVEELLLALEPVLGVLALIGHVEVCGVETFGAGGGGGHRHSPTDT